jgi:hypothetical protein
MPMIAGGRGRGREPWRPRATPRDSPCCTLRRRQRDQRNPPNR